jgi:hypothetical protein
MSNENRHEVGTRALHVRGYGVSKGACCPLGGAWTDSPVRVARSVP